MRVTVLLLSVDEAAMLERSLPAAMAQEPRPEVVVIDNACHDGTAALAARHGARHLRLPARRTYAAAINEAIAQTGGDAVLLLNADCFLPPGFLAAAMARLAEPGIGSVAPKLLRARGPQGRQALGQIDTAAMVVDRRRKNGLVGHGRPSDAFAARRRCSAPTARPRCTGARRSPSARSGTARCSTRTWSCGRRTPISPGAPSCWAGVRLRAGRGRRARAHLQPVDAPGR